MNEDGSLFYYFPFIIIEKIVTVGHIRTTRSNGYPTPTKVGET